MGLLEDIIDLFAPASARAEVIPQDLYMDALFQKLKTDPRFSMIATAAQNHPKKVNLNYVPELLDRGLLGSYHPGDKNPVIALGVPASGKLTKHKGDVRYKQEADPLAILAHELTHFLYGQSSYPKKAKLLPHMDEAMADDIEAYGAQNRGRGGYPDILDAILRVQSQQ